MTVLRRLYPAWHTLLGLRLSLSLSLSLSLGLCTVATAQEVAMTPQEKLEAVRQALVSAAMEAPTQVQTTSWIDAQGVLRESSSFQSGMTVRGVRVLSYTRDAQGQPKAEVRWQTDDALLNRGLTKSGATSAFGTSGASGAMRNLARQPNQDNPLACK